MAIIVEVLGWGGKRRKSYKIDAGLTSIGRGYNNDIVLADPHVSANHLRLIACEGGWDIIDLDSLNGLQVIKNPSADERIFASGSEIKIGRTRLRLISESHVLEETKLLHRLERDTSQLNRLSVWLPLFFAMFCVQLLSSYAGTVVEWEWKNALPVIVSAQLVIFIGAVFWSLVGRLVRQEAYFLGQYSLILMASLLFVGGGWLLSTLHYNFSSILFGDLVQQLVTVAILGVLLSANLALATNLSSRARWTGGAFFAGVLLIIGSVGQMKSWGEFSPFPQYSSTLAEPRLLAVGGQTTEEFFADIDTLFQLADKAALEK